MSVTFRRIGEERSDLVAFRLAKDLLAVMPAAKKHNTSLHQTSFTSANFASNDYYRQDSDVLNRADSLVHASTPDFGTMDPNKMFHRQETGDSMLKNEMYSSGRFAEQVHVSTPASV